MMNEDAINTMNAKKALRSWTDKMKEGRTGLTSERAQNDKRHAFIDSVVKYQKIELKNIENEIVENTSITARDYGFYNIPEEAYWEMVPILLEHLRLDYSPDAHSVILSYLCQGDWKKSRLEPNLEEELYRIAEKSEEWQKMFDFDDLGQLIGQIATRRHSPILERVAIDKRFKKGRIYALDYLVKFEKKNASDAVLECLNDEQQWLVFAAIEHVRKLKLAEAKLKLRELAENHPLKDVRENAKKTLKVLENVKEGKPFPPPKLPKASVVLNEGDKAYEFSSAFDIEDVAKFLRTISTKLKLKLPQKALIYQMEQLNADPDEPEGESEVACDVVVSWKSSLVPWKGEESTPLKIVFFLDDFDTVDIYFFSTSRSLINAITKEGTRVLEGSY